MLFRRIPQINNTVDLLNAHSLQFDGSGKFARRTAKDTLPSGVDQRMNQGIECQLTSAERAELAAARRSIRDLETELAIYFNGAQLLKVSTSPKGDSRRRGDRWARPAGECSPFRRWIPIAAHEALGHGAFPSRYDG